MTEKERYLKILEGSQLKADHEFDKPPICLEIDGDYGKQIFATLGNFSTVLARPKVGKTTTIAIAVSSILSGKRILKFIPALRNQADNEKKKVLWIDTEQGKPECVKTIRIISRLVNGDEKKHPDNLKFLSIRQFGAKERTAITDFAINYFTDISFVVIDGIRDFVSSINDEKEATFIADKLLKWTQEKNIHILTILHQNKGDANARGHLGTELINKAETVAKLSREETNGTRLTVIEPDFTRHKEFEKFAFSLGDDGKLSIEQATQSDQSRVPKPEELTLDQIKEIVSATFEDPVGLPYAATVQRLKAPMKTLCMPNGDNKTKALLSFLQNNNYIRKNDNTKLYSSNIPV